MGRVSSQQNTFSGGEFSQLMLGRQDVEKYKSALQTCFNALILVQGGWTRRPGTLRLNQTRGNGTSAAFLIPFAFSTAQRYMFEFGDEYIRFYSGHGLITQTPQAITDITNGNPGVATYSGADTYANGDRVYITDVVRMTQVNNREFRVKNVDTGTNTFELADQDDADIDTTAYDTYASDGSVAEILHLTSPYAIEDIPTLRFFQSADVIYLTHPDYPTYKLIRTSALSWSLVQIGFLDGPYMAVNPTTTTLTPSAATGASITITASSVVGINNDTGFQTTDVGRLIRLREGSTWGYVTILTRVSTTIVTASVASTLTNTNAKVSWRLGLWSDTTGFAANGVFYEDRLVLAGTTVTPQRFDLSKTGDYENFAPSSTTGAVADDNAISFTLNSKDVNPIYWMVNNIKALLIGTGGSEWQVKPSSLGTALTPTNVSAKRMSSYGSINTAPVEAGVAVLFLQKAARKLREMAYVFQDDTFLAPDMTLLAEHVSHPGIIKLALQLSPQPIIWALKSDGSLTALSYSREQSVTGWHRHEIAGPGDAEGGPCIVEDIAAQISPDGTRDELWLIVQRYINGETVRSVEVMTKIWESTDDILTSFYADYGWTQISGSPTATVDGLFWLEGETVGVMADASAHPPRTVTNGKITLDYTASVVTLGYHYNSDGEDLPDESNSNDGSGQGKTKRIGRIGFWVMDMLGFTFGPALDRLTRQITSLWGQDFGVAKPLVTGVFREMMPGDFDKIGSVAWRCNGPFPGTVLSLMTQTTVSDES